ncbi:MAG TPA: ATP-binding cassette domain-containing protein [Kofleriaceae bacterium]|nr:ATP-binding cassette domain-containing protein [Kofleriaceae bacterium]
MAEPIVDIRGLDFSYRGAARPILQGIDLRVGAGERCLLVGANGAGKTTLLRILAGKHMVAPEVARVLGRSAFHDTGLAEHVDFLGGDFPFEVDIQVGSLVDGVHNVDPARRADLIQLLGVDLDWHMHRISAGQRRRVQILLGLLRPVRLLLLDEVTTDLDLLARADLLDFLRRDSEARATAILYATHIFDGLEHWATHLAWLSSGRLRLAAPIDDIGELAALRQNGVAAPLYALVSGWLRSER